MKVYISVDMEGVAGVVHVDQTRRSGSDYEKARHWMTAEANAAVAGAFDGGAEAVLVNDAHGDMRNLVLDQLDARAEIISGALKPLSMVEGHGGHQAALFIGYHAGAGSRAGVLEHTYFGRVVARCRVNGRDFNETAINAIVCGASAIPVALVSGDATACTEARALLGEVETVEVKTALSRYAARSLHPKTACERIREGAARAVRRAGEGAFAPLQLDTPLRLEVDFVNAGCADAAALVPGTERIGGTTTAYEAQHPATLIHLIQAWTRLAGTTMV